MELLTVGVQVRPRFPNPEAQRAQQISKSGMAQSGDCGLSIWNHLHFLIFVSTGQFFA
jgi:hypothetical protein